METNNKPRSFRVVVAGIVIKDEFVLLLQRHSNDDVFPGLWELPSGKREFGESSIAALTREIQEETGLSVVIGSPVSIFEYVIEKETEIRDTTQINFLVSLAKPDQNPVVSEEHQLAKWFSKDEVEALVDISDEVRGVVLSILVA